MKEYIKLYEEAREGIYTHSAPLLNVNRENAYEHFKKVGFPTNKDEAYLYCRLLKQLDTDYGMNVNQVKIPFNPTKLFQCAVSGIKSLPYFMVNDYFYPNTDERNLPEGVIMCGMKEACEKYPALVEKYYGKKIKDNKDPFVAFNEMFAQDGYFLYVAKNARLEVPIQLVNVLRANFDLMVNTRNLIIVEEGADARILICDHALDKQNFFANRMTEVFVGENAQLQYYGLEHNHDQTNNLAQVYIDQAANSRVVTNLVGVHNGRTRNYVEVDLVGKGADTWLGGMLVSDKEQQTENFTVIRHIAPHCTSNELFKYILDEKSEGAFSGRVVVEDAAQKTSSQQTNRNILLCKEATMYAKPQLEIYADDVKCGHGATTGQLDETAMFYMQQRGIGKKEARLLLLEAFAADVMEHIEMPAVKEQISNMVHDRLRKEGKKCAACGLC